MLKEENKAPAKKPKTNKYSSKDNEFMAGTLENDFGRSTPLLKPLTKSELLLHAEYLYDRYQESKETNLSRKKTT